MDYNTQDLCLAAYLKLNGAKIVSITKDGSRGTFHLSDVDQQLLTAFSIGEATVEPQQYNNMVRTLTTSVKRS